MAPTPIITPPVLAAPGVLGILPFYGWKAIRALNQIVSSADGSAFSRIPDPVMGIVWYSREPYKALFYGDVTTQFFIPDGTFRQRATMSPTAYQQLADKIQTDPTLDIWPF